MGRIVIVGGGLGALRTAEAVRAAGSTDQITVVGDEPAMPYNRPPLSKSALADGVDIAALEFRRRASLDDVTWRLGTRVVAADLSAGRVELDDGSRLEADGVVVATGIRPRRLTIPGPQEGRFVLRTTRDAERLRPRLVPGARLLVMGAGFIGCEVAATARGLGCDVTVVAMDDEPMVRPLGPMLGAGMRRRHERNGVRFHLGRTIDSFHGDSSVESATLSDGTHLPADVVVEAVGSVPNTDWLDGNGLDLSDGVLVDSAMRVVGSTMPAVAVGDIARHPNALFGDVPYRIEHWSIPTETGRRAGRTLAALLAGEEPDTGPFTALPTFWSDQYDITLQSFGMPGLATEVTLVDGDADGPCIAEYRDTTGLVGVVGIDRTSDLAAYRSALNGRISS